MPTLPERSLIHPRSVPLLDKVRSEARNASGVYRFLGPRGEVLYVGKSVRLRARLLSYFRAPPEEKPGELVRVAAGIEWEYIPTEFESLLREFRLIRAFRPRFNVQHRRERRFAWVRFAGGAAPRLSATRSPAPGDDRIFGPFPAPRDLPHTLHRLAHLQGLRDCSTGTPMRFSDQLDLLSDPLTPLCPRAEMGSCLGPCAALCSLAGYDARVRETIDFLRGASDDPLDRLRERMEVAAARREYEAAARLRDTEERLRHLRDEIVAFGAYLERLTCVYRVPIPGGGVRAYLLRKGRVRDTFDEGGEARQERNGVWEREGGAERIRALLREAEPAAAALSVEEREELFLTARWFRAHPEELERTVPVDRYIEGLLAPRTDGSDTPIAAGA